MGALDSLSATACEALLRDVRNLEIKPHHSHPESLHMIANQQFIKKFGTKQWDEWFMVRLYVEL